MKLTINDMSGTEAAVELEWNVGSLAMGAAFLSGMTLAMSIALLTLLVRLNRRAQSLENWMAREFARLHENMGALHRLLMEQAQRSSIGALPSGTAQPHSQGAIQPGVSDMQQYYQPSPFAPPRRPVQMSAPADRFVPAHGKELVQAVNNLLVSNQPFNFSESLQETHPRLTLLRMSPRGTPDLWSAAVLLDPGGEGYFSWIDQNRAYLFPNYDRFSTTHDPKLLFDGARLDARIHAVIKPAVLARSSDGAWQLVDKGQVQMR
ncbi:MAG: hypothetical protein LBH66_05650 [Oscillospiraceae bacterium]|jgi:hypothetical protein|nr:hypothetical protein [Oscillospiraceae bacterium]